MNKKFNYNIIVFVVVSILIIGGWCSGYMIKGNIDAVINFINEPSIDKFIEDIDESSKRYSWRFKAVDIYSLTYRLTGTRWVHKDDDMVVRMDNDYLDFDRISKSEDDIRNKAESCAELNEFCNRSNIPFLYVCAPKKAYFGEYPIGNENTEKVECNSFISQLRQRGVNVLSIADLMEQQNKSMEENYFITDHHWLPETAFWATGEILKKMNEDYGLEYDIDKTNIENYNVKTYKKCFLGTQGKKTGRFFSVLGLDDISIITPKFDTELTVNSDIIQKRGQLEDTLIFARHLEFNSVHASNPYAAYGGGEVGELIVKNHNNPDGSKILLIRNSYAHPVIPFLSLNAQTIHALDLRDERSVDSISDYIKEYDFDYVIILYSGIEGNRAYDFNLN